LLEAMQAARVAKVVLVQHLGEYDNAYLAGAIRSDPGRYAGVALIDPFVPDWRAQLAEVATAGFGGLRFPVEWLRTRMDVAVAAAAAGLKPVIYVADDMASAVHLIRRLAQAIADSTVVVAHLGAPRVHADGAVDGRELLDLATERNVWVTLSGLSMFAPHPHSELALLITEVIEAFGSRRVMWGSNYPVGLATEGYDDDLALILDRPWGLHERDVADIVGGSAGRLWFGGDPTDLGERRVL
jgi:L-fuconolactonase